MHIHKHTPYIHMRIFIRTFHMHMRVYKVTSRIYKRGFFSVVRYN